MQNITLENIHVYYELLLNCNANCPFCPLPEEVRHGKLGKPKKRERVRKDFEKLTDIGVTTIAISGGEPLLALKDGYLLEVLDIAREYFEWVGVISNFSIPRVYELEGRLDLAFASIDYIGEKHDRMRGIKGLFKTAIRQVSKNEFTGIRSMQTRDNIEDLLVIMQWVKDPSILHRAKPIPLTIVPYKGTDPRMLPRPQDSMTILRAIVDMNLFKQVMLDHPNIRMLLGQIISGLDPKVAEEVYEDLVRRQGHYCDASYRVLGLEYDGTITPCPFLRWHIAKIDEPVEEIRRKIIATRKKIVSTYNGICRNCPFRHMCGGCLAGLNTECVFYNVMKRYSMASVQIAVSKGLGTVSVPKNTTELVDMGTQLVSRIETRGVRIGGVEFGQQQLSNVKASLNDALNAVKSTGCGRPC